MTKTRRLGWLEKKIGFCPENHKKILQTPGILIIKQVAPLAATIAICRRQTHTYDIQKVHTAINKQGKKIKG
jgi:hypothetical protein